MCHLLCTGLQDYRTTGVCVGGLIVEPRPPPCLYMKASQFNLFIGWLVSVGEIVDDVEINVCFLLTRKSWSWVE